MKRTIMIAIAALVVCLVQAKVVQTTIRLNNDSSKSKVENVAKRIKGVTAAKYSTKSKTLTVSYDNKKTSASKIKAALNKAGYKSGTSRNGVNNNKTNTTTGKNQQAGQYQGYQQDQSHDRHSQDGYMPQQTGNQNQSSHRKGENH